MPKRRIAPEVIKQLKKKIRKYTQAGKGMCMERVITDLGKYLTGWLSYYKHCQTPSVLTGLEAWIRRRLRCAFWRQWKTGKNKAIQLRRRGVGYNLSVQTAGTNKGPWHISSSPALCIAMPNKYFEELGLPRLKCLT